MKQEEQLMIHRFMDLSRQAYQRNVVVFSDFLNMYEIDLLYREADQYLTSFSLSGGYDYAERQMVAFQPDALYYDWDYPISLLELAPVSAKFSSEMTHRDVLGAVMHLGIDRSKIGDIIVKDRQIYIFASDKIADYLLDELYKIRHTQVKGHRCQNGEIHVTPQFKDGQGFVASNRLDAFVAEICKLSRSKASEMLLQEKVFVNGRCITNPNHKLNPGDILSVRGFGKVIFDDF